MEYDLKDFEKDVLEASRSTPVVIDFWAEWCAPCRQLGPTIEKLAGEAEGRWKLVKIDTEKNPDLAIKFGVRGIPAVKMIYQEEVIAEFTGAQPEHLIRNWLEENLPDGDAAHSEEVLEKIEQLLREGERDRARSFADAEVTERSSAELKVRYAMLLLPDRLEEAREWMEEIDEAARYEYEIEFQVLETVSHLKEIVQGAAEVSGSEEALQLYRDAAAAMMEKDFDTALSTFIRVLQVDRTVDDDGPRKACIACFTMLGEQNPLSAEYRRAFSMSLY
ncbi:tetratricopeptide repeat protein [Halalkalibaculum sp. DA3122]|uniref:tetratricopeptide repeat protein n=1 Tax=Halalkalibaculum sp. DA3122 TaxID=3373607 RepID=UPI003754B019